MQSLLADFLNHGILPFVGRSAEIERIDAFWRSAAEAHELRAALIIGEAGIGKSKLIEEIVPRIVQSGGAVVHTRLYPDATTSIAALVARALRVLSTRRQLQIGTTEDTIPSVALAMRRLARLRPTMLIIEDLHLLESSSLREFSLLLEALADEPIAILSAARPVELPARGVLERYFVEEIELKGLSEQSLGELWNTLFVAPAGSELLGPLRGATLGNPLALRSALRGAIRAGSLSHDLVTNSWRSTTSSKEFTRALKKHVELLSEGMAAHLSPEEKEGGARLASLGEVFARETARMMLGSTPGLIDALIFKGIIAPATTQTSPLLGEEPDKFPLAFTHTLIHRQFIEHGAVDAHRLAEVVASNLPLYSVLPFQLLKEMAAGTAIPPEIRRAAINRALDCATRLDQGSDWKLAAHAVEAAARLVDLGQWDADEERILQLRVLRSRLSSLRRDTEGEEYLRLVEKMDELAGDEDWRLASFQIIVYMHRIRRLRLGGTPSDCMALWEKVARLIALYPPLRHGSSYILFMQEALRINRACDVVMAPLIEREVESLLNDDPPVRAVVEAKTLIYPYLLNHYATPEELEQRERMLREMDALGTGTEQTLTIQKIKFLFDTGRVMEAETLATARYPWFRELGLIRNATNCTIYHLATLIMRGLPLDEAETRMKQIGIDVPEEGRKELYTGLGSYFAFMAILRGELEWGERIMREYPPAINADIIELRVILATPDAREKLMDEMASCENLPDHLRTFAHALRGRSRHDAEEALTVMRRFLGRPVLSVRETLPLYAALELISWGRGGTELDDVVDALAPDIGRAVEGLMAWYESRKLPALMAPLLGRYGEYLEQKRRALWGKIIGDLAHAAPPLPVSPGAMARRTLTMLGTIELRGTDGTASQVRGSRLRALLGLLVADRMLDRPLSHREMAAILSGTDDDPDKARKTLNGVVFRLREIVGNDTVLTDRDTPRLNTDLLAVDLLDAHASFREASVALDERSLSRALGALSRGIELSRGEVAFPTLYENFFEALREDFENEIRRLILRVSRALLDEGDPRSAEELLRRGLKGMPGDEEIADLLREALLALGKRAEAERVKLQTTLEIE